MALRRINRRGVAALSEMQTQNNNLMTTETVQEIAIDILVRDPNTYRRAFLTRISYITPSEAGATLGKSASWVIERIVCRNKKEFMSPVPRRIPAICDENGKYLISINEWEKWLSDYAKHYSTAPNAKKNNP